MGKHQVQSLNGYYIGQDSEFAMADKEGAVPSTLIYPKAVVVDDMGEEFGKQGFRGEVDSDGRQVEIRTNPQYCREYACDEIWLCLRRAVQDAEKRGLKIKCQSATPMSLRRIKEGGDKCVESGCNPDFNYQGIPNSTTHIFSKAPFCFAGVHLHTTIHASSYAFKNWELHIHALDMLIGLTMEAINYDKTSNERRKFYGRAGCHRPTTYKDNAKGVEYRVLGSWVLNSPALMSLAWGMMRVAEGVMFTREMADELNGLMKRSDVEEIINTSDREQAAVAMKKIILPYLDSIMINPYNGAGSGTFDKPVFSWPEYPLQKDMLPRKIYERALNGEDFFGGFSVTDNWMLNDSYRPHGRLTWGWKKSAEAINLRK